MLGDERIDHGPRLGVRRMPVIRDERFAALEIADKAKSAARLPLL